MAIEHDTSRLDCGREIDQVWERIDLAPDAHEQVCPDCQSARLSLSELAEVTEELRAVDPVGAVAGSGDLVPSTSVKDAIMRVARAEVRRGRRLSVVADDLGSVQISEQTVSAVVRFACDTVDGVRARRCSVALNADSDTDPDAPRRVDVMLRLAIESTLSIPEVTDVVRARIDAVLAERTGLRPQRVDLLVEDVYDV